MTNLRGPEDTNYYDHRAKDAPEDAFDKSPLDLNFWRPDIIDVLKGFTRAHGAWHRDSGF